VLRKHVTFANVMSLVAVFIALGGSAVALRANSVGSRQIKDDAVKGRHVADGKIKGKDLKERAVGTRELKPTAIDLWPFVKIGSTGSFCNPTSAAFVTCATVDVATQWPSTHSSRLEEVRPEAPMPRAAASSESTVKPSSFPTRLLSWGIRPLVTNPMASASPQPPTRHNSSPRATTGLRSSATRSAVTCASATPSPS
jgi:hypothetical protein